MNWREIACLLAVGLNLIFAPMFVTLSAQTYFGIPCDECGWAGEWSGDTLFCANAALDTLKFSGKSGDNTNHTLYAEHKTLERGDTLRVSMNLKSTGALNSNNIFYFYPACTVKNDTVQAGCVCVRLGHSNANVQICANSGNVVTKQVENAAKSVNAAFEMTLTASVFYNADFGKWVYTAAIVFADGQTDSLVYNADADKYAPKGQMAFVARISTKRSVEVSDFQISLVKPSESDTPDEPDEPDTPDEPAEPDTPDEPTEPDTPDEPTEPDTPDEPTEPDTPDGPTEPDTPDEPTEPDTPDEPTEPDTPDVPTEPTEPDTPDEPTEPDTPDEPTEPDTPDEPTEPDTPNEPTEPESPEYPAIGGSILFGNEREYYHWQGDSALFATEGHNTIMLTDTFATPKLKATIYSDGIGVDSTLSWTLTLRAGAALTSSNLAYFYPLCKIKNDTIQSGLCVRIGNTNKNFALCWLSKPGGALKTLAQGATGRLTGDGAIVVFTLSRNALGKDSLSQRFVLKSKVFGSANEYIKQTADVPIVSVADSFECVVDLDIDDIDDRNATALAFKYSKTRAYNIFGFSDLFLTRGKIMPDAAIEEPEQPDPTNPDEPTIPNQPDKPEEPTEPDEQDVPNDPANPTEPDAPDEPTTPDDPTEPSEPAEPAAKPVYFGVSPQPFHWLGDTTLFSAASTDELSLTDRQASHTKAVLYTIEARVDSATFWTLGVGAGAPFSSSNYTLFYPLCKVERDTVQSGLCVRIGHKNKNLALCYLSKPGGTLRVLAQDTANTLSGDHNNLIVAIVRSLNVDGETQHFALFKFTESGFVLACETDLAIEDCHRMNAMAVEVRYSKTRADGVFGFFDLSLEYGFVPPEDSAPEPTVPTKNSLKRGDVVINEIMSQPAVDGSGMPNVEWFELYNATDSAVNLQGLLWNGKKFNEYILKPHSYVTVCPQKHREEMAAYTQGDITSTTAWLALNNTYQDLCLQTADGTVIDFFAYSNTYFVDSSGGDSFKKDGGWSLERKDPTNLSQRNYDLWAPCEDELMGTPGRANSVAVDFPDLSAPALLIAAVDSTGSVLQFTFDEPIDLTRTPESVTIGGEETPIYYLGADEERQMFLKFGLAEPIERNRFYRLGVKDFFCLAGVAMDETETYIGITEDIGPGDVVINEIMPNASPAAADYLEIFVSGKNAIDLMTLYVRATNVTGTTSKFVRFCNYTLPAYPGEYYVLSRDADGVRALFAPEHSDWLIGNTDMPPLYNEGKVEIATHLGSLIIDEVTYDEDMYGFAVSTTKNVALERISPDTYSGEHQNWRAASALCNYATPTSQNSQFAPVGLPASNDVEVTVRIFAPNQALKPDKAQITTRFTDGQWYGTAKIYSARGVVVCTLLNNTLLPTTGTITWDGYNENHELQAPGTYIFYLSVWQTGGKHKNYKKTVVLLPE